MTVSIAIATRNNPHGLAGLLSSLMAVVGTSESQGRRFNIHLSLCDSSDVPVITVPHVARLLGMVNLTYSHTNTPDRIRQMYTALSRIGGEHVIMADDDIVFLIDPRPVFTAVTPAVKVVFGIKADAFNDRGYSDFHEKPDRSNHVLIQVQNWAKGASILRSQFLESKPQFADEGLIFGCTRDLLKALEPMVGDTSAPPQVLDDAFALRLAVCSLPRVHISPHLQCIHVGNSNPNWSAHAVKQYAVQKYTPPT